MVGVARSKGCRACVKQRVKCDEATPACGRCKRFGRECPGYAKPAKFVYEIPRGKNEQKEGQGAFRHVRELDRPSPRSQGQNSSDSLSIRTTPEHQASSSPSMALSSPGVPQSIILETQGNSQALSVLMANASPTDEFIDTHFLRKWLSFIPPRLGSSKALDYAVRCTSTHYIGTLSKQESIISSARRAYGHALHSLRAAINDPDEGMSSETLCATMLLTIYELFACTKKHAWVKHAGGASRLMQIRGPQRFNTDFDRSMLRFCRGQMIMEAFMKKQPLFLCQPEWKWALSNPDPAVPSEFAPLINEFYTYVGALPGLAAETWHLDRLNIPAVVSFLNAASNLSSALRTWFINFRAFLPPPSEVPAVPYDPLYPTIYRYRGVPNVYFTSTYYGSLILLNHMSNSLQPDESMKTENKFFIDEICKSAGFSSESGLLGPYSVVFSLKMAFMAGDLTTKLWIQRTLLKMGETIPFMRHQVSMETDVVLDIDLEA